MTIWIFNWCQLPTSLGGLALYALLLSIKAFWSLGKKGQSNTLTSLLLGAHKTAITCVCATTSKHKLNGMLFINSVLLASLILGNCENKNKLDHLVQVIEADWADYSVDLSGNQEQMFQSVKWSLIPLLLLGLDKQHLQV